MWLEELLASSELEYSVISARKEAFTAHCERPSNLDNSFRRVPGGWHRLNPEQVSARRRKEEGHAVKTSAAKVWNHEQLALGNSGWREGSEAWVNPIPPCRHPSHHPSLFSPPFTTSPASPTCLYTSLGFLLTSLLHSELYPMSVSLFLHTFFYFATWEIKENKNECYENFRIFTIIILKWL